jgi:hypothetical protein
MLLVSEKDHCLVEMLDNSLVMNLVTVLDSKLEQTLEVCWVNMTERMTERMMGFQMAIN